MIQMKWHLLIVIINLRFSGQEVQKGLYHIFFFLSLFASFMSGRGEALVDCGYDLIDIGVEIIR